MKKVLLFLGLFTLICIGGYVGYTHIATVEEPVESSVEHTRYAIQGRYNGYFIWEDTTGNLWKYRTATVSNQEVYIGMPVYICLDDNATPDNLYDDKVLGIVFDRETAIYDELEASLSESFDLERDGNDIHIQSIKVVK